MICRPALQYQYRLLGFGLIPTYAASYIICMKTIQRFMCVCVCNEHDVFFELLLLYYMLGIYNPIQGGKKKERSINLLLRLSPIRLKAR